MACLLFDPMFIITTLLELPEDQIRYAVDGEGNVKWCKPEYTMFNNTWYISPPLDHLPLTLPIEMLPYCEHPELKHFIKWFWEAKTTHQSLDRIQHKKKKRRAPPEDLLTWERICINLFKYKILMTSPNTTLKNYYTKWPILAYFPWYIMNIKESSTLYFEFLKHQIVIPGAILQTQNVNGRNTTTTGNNLLTTTSQRKMHHASNVIPSAHFSVKQTYGTPQSVYEFPPQHPSSKMCTDFEAYLDQYQYQNNN